MDIADLLKQCSQRDYLVISDRELNELLHSCTILKQADTLVSGQIRILLCEDVVLLQEESNRGEIIIRAYGSPKEAEVLLNSRMETYEKMWNGCGCKIRYYE